MERHPTTHRDRPFSRRSPYRVAVVLAILLVLLAAPEVNEGVAMEPTIQDGQVLLTTKSYSFIGRKTPEPGDLVILKKPVSQAIAEDNLIARVAAVGGDHVVIQEGRVLVNDEEYVTPEGIRGAGEDEELDITLGEGEVFLLCDNREERLDSRDPDMGPVTVKDIKGDVVWRLWPLKAFGRLR